MKNKGLVHSSQGNFWTGFSLGSLLALMTLYTLGTKKGRNYLQKVIGIAENWETHLSSIVKEFETLAKNQKQENNKDNLSFVAHLLDKIKSKSN